MRSLVLGLLFLVACATTRPSPAVDWQPLFDGKTLSGWTTVGTAIWRVEDGVMVGTQDGDPKRSGVIHTIAHYQNFEIDMEFLIDEHGKYNSGVYLRNKPGSQGRTGYQVNIGRAAVHEYTGGIYTDKWLTTGDETDKVRRPGDWNRLRIRAQGGHVQVWLNETLVSDYRDPAPPAGFVAPGVIALQTYGAEGHAGFVKFRNMRLRLL